jgi:hypothetical protein
MTHTPAAPGPGPTTPATTAAPRSRARGGLALIARTITGAVLLLAGAAMLALPGPGLLVIVAGLSLLAVDYVWARRLRTHATKRLAATGRTIRRAVARRRPRLEDHQYCTGAADTDHWDVQGRGPRRDAEHHPSTEVPS